MTDDSFSRRGAAFFRSSAALIHNAQLVMSHTKAHRLIAVIKANAYGHGAQWAAQVLSQEGLVRDFAVATVDEGLHVREVLTDNSLQVILLGVQNPVLAGVMADNYLAPAVGSLDWLVTARDNLQQDNKEHPPLRVHLAIDTGMGRMGAKTTADLSSMYQFVMSEDGFELAGVFTHFATADDQNQAYYDQQKADFLSMVTTLEIDSKYWHLANSGSALFHNDEIPTATIRVGSALYGYNPAYPGKQTDLPLLPVASLKAKIWEVHQLLAGEAVSYGATYVAREDQWVGTVPIGYADGYRRIFAGMTVLVNGRKERVLGRVTMDQLIISLAEPVSVNTEVTFFGRDGDQEITIEELATYGQTIPHEVLTGIGSRIPRITLAD